MAIQITSNSSESLQGHYRSSALVSLLQLHWFIRLRWVIVVGAMLLLGLERLLLAEVERPLAIWIVVLGVGAINVVWMSVSFRIQKKSQSGSLELDVVLSRAVRFANAQVSVDLLLLTILLRYMGGVGSPLTVFYLFHMVIGALLLQRNQAIVQGIWAICLYAALGTGELLGWLAPHYAFWPAGMAGELVERDERLVLILIVVMACAVFGTLYFALHIVTRLDHSEQQLRKTNQALRASEEAIKELQRRRSRFMQTAAHQLKSPLAVIQTMASLIRDGIVMDDSVVETSKNIIRRARQGIQQVGELLALARVQEADRRVEGPKVCDAIAVVGELVQRFTPLAEEKEIALSYEKSLFAPSRHVAVHAVDLEDCVGNLIDNALKYTSAGGRVAVSLDEDPRNIKLDSMIRAVGTFQGAGDPAHCIFIGVSDSGMGMSTQQLAGSADQSGSLFDVFRRGEGALQAGIPGTGLGLSIVREVVEQTGGAIWVESEIGKGTRFVLGLPVIQSALPAASDASSSAAHEHQSQT